MIQRFSMKLILFEFVFAIVLTSTSFAEKGYFYITSTPDSATVIIDGAKYEPYFTPVLCTLAVGTHEISITKKYYTVQSFTVTIQPEVVTKQTVTFIQDPKNRGRLGESIGVPSKIGQLTLISNPLGAAVIADGEELGQVTPLTLYDIPAGKHRYSIEYRHLKFDTTIEITGDAPQTAMVDFNKFKGEDIYSIMPQVTAKVVIVVPGCEYKLDETSGALLIKGVDAEINIRTGDTSLTLTHKELADFPASSSSSLTENKKEKRLPQTEYTYIFEPYMDAKLRFDVTTFTNGRKSIPRDSAQVQTYYHNLPASLNSGEEVNVRIYIEEDGDILFRYW